MINSEMYFFPHWTSCSKYLHVDYATDSFSKSLVWESVNGLPTLHEIHGDSTFLFLFPKFRSTEAPCSPSLRTVTTFSTALTMHPVKETKDSRRFFSCLLKAMLNWKPCVPKSPVMGYLFLALQKLRAPQRCSARTSKPQEKQGKGDPGAVKNP